MVASGSSSRSHRQRWQGAWLLVLALAVAPALTPLTQRLGFSVAERAGLNKRSEYPPKKADGAAVVDFEVSPVLSTELDAGTPRHAPPPVDDILEAFETLKTPDSLRAPPSTLSL